MNESYFESIFAIFNEKSPFLSILDTFWTIFGHFSYSTSIKESLTIELNYLFGAPGQDEGQDGGQDGGSGVQYPGFLIE